MVFNINYRHVCPFMSTWHYIKNLSMEMNVAICSGLGITIGMLFAENDACVILISSYVGFCCGYLQSYFPLFVPTLITSTILGKIGQKLLKK